MRSGVAHDGAPRRTSVHVRRTASVRARGSLLHRFPASSLADEAWSCREETAARDSCPRKGNTPGNMLQPATRTRRPNVTGRGKRHWDLSVSRLPGLFRLNFVAPGEEEELHLYTCTPFCFGKSPLQTYSRASSSPGEEACRIPTITVFLCLARRAD